MPGEREREREGEKESRRDGGDGSSGGAVVRESVGVKKENEPSGRGSGRRSGSWSIYLFL